MSAALRHLGLASVLAAAFAGQACAPSTPSDDADSSEQGIRVASKRAVDVGDLTVLFGKGQRTFFPDVRLLPTDAAAPRPILADDFARIVQFGQNPNGGGVQFAMRSPEGDRDAARPDLWRVVAMRFVPCAPGVGALNAASTTRARWLAVNPAHGDAIAEDAQGRLAAFGIRGVGTEASPDQCHVHVRLVAQPVDPLAASIEDLDYGMHLVYDLGALPAVRASGALEKMVLGVQAIKDASLQAGAPTNGVALGVHPGLAREAARNTEGAVSQAVVDFVRTFATPTHLVKATFMGLELQGGLVLWNFFQGKMARDANGNVGPWTPTDMEAFKFPTKDGTAWKAGSQRVLVQKFRTTSEPTPFDPVPKATLGPLDELSMANLPSDPFLAAARAFRIEDPHFANAINTDCVSCHTAGTMVKSLRFNDTTPRWKAPAGVTAYLDGAVLPAERRNTRALGYFHGTPTISGRVRAETGEQANFYNQFVLRSAEAPEGVMNPGYDCTRVDYEVFGCFQSRRPSRECLSACVRPAP